MDREIGILQFGEYELSKAERTLLRRGRVVSLQARPFDLLVYLLENRDRVITRDELLLNVWRGVRVNEQALRFALHSVRQAIGDSGHAQRVIRTVRGTGLQFVAAVTTRSSRAVYPLNGDSAQLDESFLGRERFTSTLERTLDIVATGGPCTILCTGEAGIGKTTALLRAAMLASDRGFRVGSARCAGTDQAPALWPWIQVLRRLLENESTPSLSTLMGAGAEAVTWLLPELQGLLPGSVSSPTNDSRASRYQLFESVHLLLRALAGRGPVAILLDDLHEADRLSLQLLQHLSAELAGSRSLLFATFRAPGVYYKECAEAVASVLRLRGSALITFSNLSAAEVAIIAESRSGARPSQAAVRSLLSKTNGNPFFVLQILKVLENEGRLETLSLEQPLEYSIPRAVRDAIGRQTGCLSSRVKELLSIASVMGGDFTSALLARALGARDTQIRADLESALDAGICLSDDEGCNYRFSHGLVREAIYASLTVTERADKNARLALAMEALAAPEFGALSAEIARHFAAAYPDPVSERAIGFLIRAARWDVERAAFDSAAAHLERAVTLLSRLSPGNGGVAL